MVEGERTKRRGTEGEWRLRLTPPAKVQELRTALHAKAKGWLLGLVQLQERTSSFPWANA